jgi:hypothetical protein
MMANTDFFNTFALGAVSEEQIYYINKAKDGTERTARDFKPGNNF